MAVVMGVMLLFVKIKVTPLTEMQLHNISEGTPLFRACYSIDLHNKEPPY